MQFDDIDVIPDEKKPLEAPDPGFQYDNEEYEDDEDD